MAFEGLSSRLQEITRKLRGKARITESDLKEVLREVKLALLEADVNYKIVKEFIKTVEEKINEVLEEIEKQENKISDKETIKALEKVKNKLGGLV